MFIQHNLQMTKSQEAFNKTTCFLIKITDKFNKNTLTNFKSLWYSSVYLKTMLEVELA